MKFHLINIVLSLVALNIADAQELPLDLRRVKDAPELRKDMDAFTDAMEQWGNHRTTEAYGKLVVVVAGNLNAELDEVAKSHKESALLFIQMKADLIAIAEQISSGFDHNLFSNDAPSEAVKALLNGIKKDQKFSGALEAGGIMAADSERQQREKDLTNDISSSLASFLVRWHSAGGVDNYLLLSQLAMKDIWNPQLGSFISIKPDQSPSPFTDSNEFRIACEAKFTQAKQYTDPKKLISLKPARLVTREYEDDVLITTGVKSNEHIVMKGGTQVGVLPQRIGEDFIYITTPDGTIGIVPRANCKLLKPEAEYGFLDPEG